MANFYKILGQAQTSANGTQTLYTVPSGRVATISSIIVNVAYSGNGVSVWVVKSGDSASSTNKLLNNYIGSNDGFKNIPQSALDMSGVTLAAGDSIVVGQGNYGGTIAFTLFGMEVG